MEKVMNIQIFGKSKCFDTKKAERYFKERKIKYQLINMTEKGMSKGEYNSVKQAVGGYENLIDEKAKDKDSLMLIKYLADEAKEDKLLENFIEKLAKLDTVVFDKTPSQYFALSFSPMVFF